MFLKEDGSKGRFVDYVFKVANDGCGIPGGISCCFNDLTIPLALKFSQCLR
jgi:hypothetical protein